MAALVLIDPFITIDAIDMSAFIKEVKADVEADDVDTTTFGPDGWKTRLAGLKGGEIVFTFNTDFDLTTVDDRLWGWFNAGTAIAVVLKAADGATSATNPSYSGDVVPLKMMPLAGKVGELAEQSLTWPLTGPLARATS